ncbi:MAG: glycosyltransferase family 2 protein [Promethearchaeota archaeon]
MNNSDIRISIIFPSHDREDVIGANLESIKNLENLHEIETIIIDNNSQDSTKDIIKSFIRSNKNIKITLVEKYENLGFSVSINIAAKMAKGEYIFITNDDVAFEPDFFLVLLRLYHELKRDKEIIITPAVLFTGGYVNYFGGKVHFLGFSYTPEMYQKISREPLTFRTLKVAGCSVFMKRQTFLELKGFDTFFFMYHEDSDISLNAIRNGIFIYTTNETVLHHQKLHMMLTDFTYYYIERNRYLLIYKHIDKLRGLIPYFLITEIMLFIQAILKGYLKLRFRVYKFLIQKRKRIKSLRYNQDNKKTIKMKKNYLDRHLDPIVLGQILIEVKILRFFIKLFNLIL